MEVSRERKAFEWFCVLGFYFQLWGFRYCSDMIAVSAAGSLLQRQSIQWPDNCCSLLSMKRPFWRIVFLWSSFHSYWVLLISQYISVSFPEVWIVVFTQNLNHPVWPSGAPSCISCLQTSAWGVPAFNAQPPVPSHLLSQLLTKSLWKIYLNHKLCCELWLILVSAAG